MTNDSVPEIAKKLTKAQRATVLAMDDLPRLPGRDSFNANAAFNLLIKGVAYICFDKYLMRERFALTETGLAVRAYLASQS